MNPSLLYDSIFGVSNRGLSHHEGIGYSDFLVCKVYTVKSWRQLFPSREETALPQIRSPLSPPKRIRAADKLR